MAGFLPAASQRKRSLWKIFLRLASFPISLNCVSFVRQAPLLQMQSSEPGPCAFACAIKATDCDLQVAANTGCGL